MRMHLGIRHCNNIYNSIFYDNKFKRIAGNIFSYGSCSDIVSVLISFSSRELLKYAFYEQNISIGSNNLLGKCVS